jgi:GTP-binding protein HflX
MIMTQRKSLETNAHAKTLIISVDAPYNTIGNIELYFEEFRNLVKTNRIMYDAEFFVKLRSIDPAYFITKGKLDDIKDFCIKNEIEEVIISEPLSGQQERNLEDILDCPVLDRTGLILQIFQKAAQSAEGKIQVAIASFQHQKTRLAGRGIFMSQQAGHRGTRGPGQTAKERELLHIKNTILKLKKQLNVMHKARETQRKKRITSTLPHICLIGYTNAGKSTILNSLTNSDVYAHDQLFATLDTTTRELYIDGKKRGLLSDTVGFIQLLPHHLIEAFKSTLSELQYADLLLLVVDAADSNFPNHISVVQEILRTLQVDKPIVYVFNKIDKVDDMQILKQQIESYAPHVLVSGLAKESLQELSAFIDSFINSL